MKISAFHIGCAVPVAAAALVFSAVSAHAQTVGAWDARAATPAVISDVGGALAYPGSGDFIYATRQNGSNAFWRYSISENSWTTLAVIPETPVGGVDLEAPGNGKVYLTCYCATNSLYEYDIATNAWTAKANPSVSLGGSADDPAMASTGGDLIYVLRSGGNHDFLSYSISGNSWTETLASTPDIVNGSFGALVYPGSGTKLYALRASDGRFEEYDITGDTWTTKTSPFGASSYSTLTAANGVIYALRDGGTTDFLSYSISGNSWTSLAAISDAAGTGNDIIGVGNSTDGFRLFATRGGGFDNFYRYTISAAAGGSAGSAFLLARQDAGLVLARATAPAAPTNVSVAPAQCGDNCRASIAFSYAPLAVHAGRPLTFAFIDEHGQTLGSIYEPFAGVTTYTLELKNLPLNSPINGRLCAQFGPSAGCANVQSWTLLNIDDKRVKLSAEVDGDRYRVRVQTPPYPNEGVEQSSVRLEIMKNGGNVFGAILQRSGDFFVSLPPGTYTFILTPINARGAAGIPVKLPLTLQSFGEALTLDADARVAENRFVVGFTAISNRLGNNGFEFLLERNGDALQFTANDGAPVEVRLNLTATLVPLHTTKVNGAPVSEKERFTFVFSCLGSGVSVTDACKPVSVLAQKGNIVSRAADIREELAMAKTLDAVVTASMRGNLMHATVSVIGKELSGLEGVLEFPVDRLRGGEGTAVFTVADALGNRIAKVAPVSIAGAPARIAFFDVAASAEPEEKGDIIARAVVDYRNFAERALFLNLSFAEEAMLTGEPLPTVPRLVQALVTRDDGTGAQFALFCEENCGITAIAAPTGAPLEVVAEENPDGTVRAIAGGVMVTYDAANALPMLIGADGAGFARAELRARYASFGFGNIIGEFRANEALARAVFTGTGGFLNLFPEVIERVIFDLAPLIVNYIAPQNLAPIIESVEGARVVSQSRPVRILKEASEVGAPVSPLLNTIRNLFAP